MIAGLLIDGGCVLKKKWFYYSLLYFSLLLFLSGCSLTDPGSTFDVKGEIAKKQLDLFMLTLWLGTVVFILVAAVMAYIIWRYRAKNEEDAKSVPAQVHGNTIAEVVWWIIPVLLLAVIAWPTVDLTYYQEAAEQRTAEGELVVNVTGYQWWWKFEYPEYGILTANELHVPEGRRVTLKLNAGDVLHSFWVPKLAGKKDIIPNQENILWFVTDELDDDKSQVYYGQCAELCLGAHAYMRFRVVVDTQENFDEWVEKFQNAKDEPISSDPLVAKGKQYFMQKGCAGCHSVANENFAVGTDNKPDLTNFGLRYTVGAGVKKNTDENLAIWIRDPQKFKPANYMPTLWTGAEGEEEQIDALVAFLQSLGKEDSTQAIR